MKTLPASQTDSRCGKTLSLANRFLFEIRVIHVLIVVFALILASQLTAQNNPAHTTPMNNEVLAENFESQPGSFLEACFVAEFCDSSSPEARSVCLP